MPTDAFHLSFVVAPGLITAIFLIGREFTGDHRPDATFVALSIICGVIVIAGTVIGVVFLAPLMQMAGFALTGDPRPWPAFVSLRPMFLGLGWLIGAYGTLAIMMSLTGIGVRNE
jgi:hypothetical protein